MRFKAFQRRFKTFQGGFGGFTSSQMAYKIFEGNSGLFNGIGCFAGSEVSFREFQGRFRNVSRHFEESLDVSGRALQALK